MKQLILSLFLVIYAGNVFAAQVKLNDPKVPSRASEVYLIADKNPYSNYAYVRRFPVLGMLQGPRQLRVCDRLYDLETMMGVTLDDSTVYVILQAEASGN